MDTEKTVWGFIIFGSGLILLGLLALLVWGFPQYRIYTQTMKGKADLMEAEWSKKVQIEDAIGRLEAEKLNAQSEVERAKGMAEAIRIENGQLTDKYIQYLWVRNVEGDGNTTIYIPTEANLPILEANPTR